MDVTRGLSHQGLGQGFADTFPPEARFDAEGAKLQAVRVRLEGDKPDDVAGLLRHPQRVGLQARIIQFQAFGETDGAGDILRAGFPDAHFRPLYHARRRDYPQLTRREEIHYSEVSLSPKEVHNVLLS